MSGAAAAAPAAPAAAPSGGSGGGSQSNGATGAETSQPQPNVSSKPANNVPGAKPGETAAETRQRLKFKAKVDGREQELEWDEAEAARTYQKARHYEKQHADFEKRQRDFDSQLEAVAKSPLEFFRERGVDLLEIGRAEAQRQQELEAMDPNVRALNEAQARIKQLEQAQENARAEQQRAQAQAEHQALVQRTASTLDAAIKLSGMKRSGQLLRLYADVMEMAEHNGEPPMSPEQVVAAGAKLRLQRLTPLIKESLADPAWRGQNAALVKELAAVLVSNLEGGQLAEMFGKDAVRRITKHSLTAFQKSPLPATEVPLDGPPAPAAAPAQRQNSQTSQSMWGILDSLGTR